MNGPTCAHAMYVSGCESCREWAAPGEVAYAFRYGSRVGAACGHATYNVGCRTCAREFIQRAQLGVTPKRAPEQDPSIRTCATQPDPPPGHLTATGRWRVYFNKHGAAGLPWCVAPDEGGWELAVTAVAIGIEAETRYQPKATPDDEDGRPSAWLAVHGKLTVAAGLASIGAP